MCFGSNHFDVINDCLAAVSEVKLKSANLADVVFEIVGINPSGIAGGFAF